jgi:hypothetical protein
MKRLRKFTGALLAFIMAFTAVPFARVAANPQVMVDTLVVSNTVNKTPGVRYQLDIQWNRPGSAADEHRATFYEVQFRNMAVRNAPWATERRIDTEEQSISANSVIMPFTPSSIYSVRAFPGHTHAPVIDSFTGAILVPGATMRPPNNYPINPQSRTTEILYLSDIEVTAFGRGNGLTVNWRIPMMFGRDIFVDGYTIYFEPLPENNAQVSWGAAGHKIDVNISDANIAGTNLRSSGGWYTYEIDGNQTNYQFTPGLYAVKVEPRIQVGAAGVQELRYNALSRRIIVEGVEYTLLFRPERETDYRAVRDALISFSFTDIYRETEETIRLNWQLPSNIMRSLPPPNQHIRQIEMIEILSMPWDASRPVPQIGDDGVMPQLDRMATVATIEATFINGVSLHAESTRTLLLNKPPGAMIYQIKVYFTAASGLNPAYLYSDISLYVPDLVTYVPTRPNIVAVEDTVTGNNIRLNLWWEAFFRHPHDTDERPLDPIMNLIRPRYLAYDIWISDDFELLQRLGPDERIGRNIPVDSLAYVTKNGVQTYHASFNTYVTEDANGVRQTIPMIMDNKVYYIRIEVSRPGFENTTSEPAFASYFVMPLPPMDRWPLMMNRLPLRLGEITQTTIDVEWNMTWREIWYEGVCPVTNEPINDWFSSVARRPNGSLVFGSAITAEDRDSEFYVDLTDMEMYGRLDSLAAALNRLSPNLGLNPIRFMDLNGCDFEIHVVPYDTVLNHADGFDGYIQRAIDPDRNQGMWRRVGSFDPENPRYTITGLQSNTAYMILFRPIITIGGNVITAYLPHHLVATTLVERPHLDITPTVPVLQPVEEGQMHLRVRFQYTEGLMYELRYSDTFAHWTDGGTLVRLDNIRPSEVEEDADGTLWYYYEIERLFPLTMYYIWIRAYADNSAGREFSYWSNPIDMRTTDLANPIPPQRLGPASQLHLSLINRELDLQYTTFGPNHIAIEWERNPNDPFTAAANFIEMVGVHEILSHPSMIDTYMVKFNGLRVNNSFYVRAKTVLTVTMTNEGVVSYYQYVVQVSNTSDFIDVIEITVPTAIGALHPVYTIVRESDWSVAIRLYTERDGSEYDSDVNPNMFPLPRQDFELIWHWQTETLTMRFRSFQTGNDGSRDNLVDQRFITMLIQNRVYDYYVDLSTHNNVNVRNGILELPYSIISTMAEREISLHIIFGDTTYTFEPGFMRTEQVNSLSGFGLGSRVRFTLNRNIFGAPATFMLGSTAASVQKLGIEAVSNVRTVSMDYTAKPIGVAQRMANRMVAMDNNVTSYALGARDNAWVPQDAVYDAARDEFSFKTNRVGFYMAASRPAPVNHLTDPAIRDAMFNITNHMVIRDIGGFNPNDAVPANALNKILAAVAVNAREVFIHTPLTPNERALLVTSGWMVFGVNNGNAVTRQEAFNSLVRLHETRAGLPVRGFPSAQTSAFPDMAATETRFMTGMLKAERLGFLQGSAANPNGNFTYGDLIRVLDYILS